MPAMPVVPEPSPSPSTAALPDKAAGAADAGNPAAQLLASVERVTRPDAVTQVTRWVAVGSLLGLIMLGLAWELWLAPTGQRTLVWKVLPLVLPLAGLLKHRLYTYRWVSLMVWLYFIEGTVRATSGSGPSVPLAWIEVVLCLALFAACAVHVRWRLQQARQAAQPPTSADASTPTAAH